MGKLPFFPTIGKTLKNSFFELYNSFGFTVVSSSVWFVACLPVIFLVSITVNFFFTAVAKHTLDSGLGAFVAVNAMGIAFWNGLLVGPLTTAIYSMRQEMKEQYPGLKTFFILFKQYYWRSALLHWAFSFSMALLFFNCTTALVGKSIVFMLAGIFSIYIILFLALMSLFFNPLLNLNNSFKAVIKKSFLLTMDNLGLTLCLAFGLLVFLLVSIVIPIFLVIAYGAFFVYIVNNMFDAVWSKYDQINDEHGGANNG